MDFSRLTNMLDSLPDGKTLPGLSLIVYYKNEKVYEHSTGYADWENKVPMKGDEQYFFYSMTKPITCTAAMQLYEKGKFLLSDPLYEYIPEFKDITVKTDDGVKPCERPIKIVDLFTMSAGLDYNLESDAVKAVKTRTNGKVPTVEFVRELAKVPLSFEPGAHFQYSLCHDVIAGLVEVISGERFSEYMRKNIFEPVGMKNSTFDETQIDKSKFAKQYWYVPETNSLRLDDLSCMYKLGSEYDSGGAGLISTANDYALFTNTMANSGITKTGEKIISKNTIDLIRTNMLDEKRIVDFGNWYYDFGYGYGLGVRTMVDLGKGGANGSLGEFGWDGAAGSFGLMDPDKNLAIAYTQHVIGYWNQQRHMRIKNVVYSCIE